MKTNKINEKFLDVLRDKTGTASLFSFDSDFMKAHFKRDYSLDDYVKLSLETYNPVFYGFDMQAFVPALKFETEIVAQNGGTVTERLKLKTDAGEKYFEVNRQADTHIRLGEAHIAPVEHKEDFAVFDWYCDVIRRNDWTEFKKAVNAVRGKYGETLIYSMFLTPPFELLYWTRRENIYYLYYDHTGEYFKAMDAVNAAYGILMQVGAECGLQTVSYGAPGGMEFTSPSVWKEAIVPSSKAFEVSARKAGLFTQFHCCGKITKIIEGGYLNDIKPSIYETLAPPPVGDVTNPARLRNLLSKDITIHGNIDLGLLKDGNPQEVLVAAERLLDEMQGYPHILGASDSCLWPGTPIENIITINRRYNEVKGK